MKKIKSWLLLGLLLMIGLLTAIAGSRAGWFKDAPVVEQPEARDEYHQLCARYLQQDSLLNITGTILLYDGENTRQVKEQNSFHLAKHGRNVYNRLGHLQTFSNGAWTVQLDTLNRVMIVADGRHNAGTGQVNLHQSIDGLFSDTAAFRINGQVSGDDVVRTLSFRSDFNPEIREYRVTYDAKTYQLKKAVIEWWKDAVVLDTTAINRVWITQIDYRYNTPLDLAMDSRMQELITVKGKEVMPGSRYKDYQVHIAYNQDK